MKSLAFAFTILLSSVAWAQNDYSASTDANDAAAITRHEGTQNTSVPDPNQSMIVAEEERQAAQNEQRIEKSQSMYGAADTNAPGKAAMRQRHAQLIAELESIKAIAQQENATQTTAALDKLIQKEQQRQSGMRKQKPADANS
ncbi:MAG: hypothetical protein A2Y07_07370 [Planctomycetes bacterium GWF2_50_10]|nr:MAG: hypothetical protein A2Y07_07370 [Planctomycetes bacterium GWF2_50_10]